MSTESGERGGQPLSPVWSISLEKGKRRKAKHRFGIGVQEKLYILWASWESHFVPGRDVAGIISSRASVRWFPWARPG